MVAFDVLVRGGLVVDGTGAPARHADVGIAGDRIAAVGLLADAAAAAVIEAAGSIVAPGFVDTHTHSDHAPFLDDRALRLGSVRQGVTTEICGNCGFSLFPRGQRHAAAVDRHLQALFGPAVAAYPGAAAMAAAVEEQGLVANLGLLAGHGTLRAAALGFDARAATPGEAADMRSLLRDAIDEGALGLSSGLVYAPGSYAGTEELADLAGEAAATGRPYASHIRSEMDDVVGAVTEAIEIGRRSGAPVHISHLKVAGRQHHGRSGELLSLLDDARAAGADVTADVYPYTRSSTMLAALLPPWVNEGGVDRSLERLADPAARRHIAHDLDHGIDGWENFVSGTDWDGINVAYAPGSPEVEGRTILALADDRGLSPVDTVCDLLVAEGRRVVVVIDSMDEADVSAFLRWPHGTIGSDGIPLPGKPHPRWAGSFTRFLGRYVRDQGLVPLEEAVRRMSSLPATRFGLADRGRLAAGLAADVVVFDPATVADRATYADPLTPPVGVSDVLVNGVPVVIGGVPTAADPGRVLRRS